MPRKTFDYILSCSKFQLKENEKPCPKTPKPGDIWRAKDDRLIVVIKADGGSFGNPTRVSFYINGEHHDPIVGFWQFFLLSVEAEPIGRTEIL